MLKAALILSLVLMVTGCRGGAVVFAPTPAPPDLSPVQYSDPAGAFSITVPRNWAVYTRTTTTLASASFSPPDMAAPAFTAAVVRLDAALASAEFSTIIDDYQARIRSGAGRYTEVSRQAMGDGSWRLTGVLTLTSGITRQLNTFIERSGDLIGVIEVTLPDDPVQFVDVQTVINTFTVTKDSILQPAPLDVLADAVPSDFDVVNLSTWTTPTGVFFLTGEIVNHGDAPALALPVRAVLITPEGLRVAEAVDTAMGYSVPPGGFAPFSLRFGQGQPARTDRYEIILGAEGWAAQPDAVIYGPDELIWTDVSTVDERGQLFITGTVTNSSAQSVRSPRAVATVFNSLQQVIAAGFVDIVPVLTPDESAPFQIIMPEMGGEPANYIVVVQGLP